MRPRISIRRSVRPLVRQLVRRLVRPLVGWFVRSAFVKIVEKWPFIWILSDLDSAGRGGARREEGQGGRSDEESGKMKKWLGDASLSLAVLLLADRVRRFQSSTDLTDSLDGGRGRHNNKAVYYTLVRILGHPGV